MTAALLLVLKAAVVALLCAIGVGSTPADLTYLLRRPALLLRSLFAMYVAFVLAYLLSAAVVTIPYLKWRTRSAPGGAARPRG